MERVVDFEYNKGLRNGLMVCVSYLPDTDTYRVLRWVPEGKPMFIEANKYTMRRVLRQISEHWVNRECTIDVYNYDLFERIS